MARVLIGLWLVLSLAATAPRAATVAAEDLITYTARIACAANCAAQGLAPGDKALATIGLDPGGYAPGASFDAASLRSFQLVAGSFTATLADFSGIAFLGTWAGSLAKLPRLSLNASSAVLDVLDFGFIPASRTVQFTIGQGLRYLVTAPAGACQTARCGNILVGGDYVTFSAVASPVPLPAAGPLLALALAGLALAQGLRRRLSPAAPGARRA